MDLDLLMEADRRGILSPEKKALLDEARRRGLVGGEAPGGQGAPNLYSPENRGDFPEAQGGLSRVDVLDPVQGDPTMVSTVLDNVVGGYRPEMSVGEKIGTALNRGGESMTLGVVGDEAAAAADAMVGRGGYDERLSKYRGDERQFREENPGASFAAELAPALIPGAGAAGLVSKLGNVVGRVGAGALAGAAAGGLYGFSEGEGGAQERLKNARFSALAGAAFGAAAPKVTDFAASVPRRVRGLFRASAKRPTVEALKAAKNAAYKAVDDAGEMFDGDTMAGLSARVKQSFADNNYVPETDSALTATLKLLDARAGKPTTLTQIDKLRQNLWKRYANAKDQPQILDAIKAIDDVIETSGASSELMRVARAANSRYAKSQLLEDAFNKATDQTASTGSGGNILNKYRQAVTSIINNEKKAKFFTADELDMMRTFVRGSNSENMKRLVGKLSPSGSGLMMALHVVGGVASSGVTLPLMAIGSAAKSSAERSAMRGVTAIQDTLAGAARPVVPQYSGSTLAIGSAPAAERLQGEVRNILSPRQPSYR